MNSFFFSKPFLKTWYLFSWVETPEDLHSCIFAKFFLLLYLRLFSFLYYLSFIKYSPRARLTPHSSTLPCLPETHSTWLAKKPWEDLMTLKFWYASRRNETKGGFSASRWIEGVVPRKKEGGGNKGKGLERKVAKNDRWTADAHRWGMNRDGASSWLIYWVTGLIKST